MVQTFGKPHEKFIQVYISTYDVGTNRKLHELFNEINSLLGLKSTIRAIKWQVYVEKKRTFLKFEPKSVFII